MHTSIRLLKTKNMYTATSNQCVNKIIADLDARGAYRCRRTPDVLFRAFGLLRAYLYAHERATRYERAIIKVRHAVKLVVVLVRYDVREEIRASGIGKDDGLVNPVEVEPVASKGVPDVEDVCAGAI